MKISIKQVQTFLQVLQKKFLLYLFKFFLRRLLKNKVTYGQNLVVKKLAFKLEFVPVCDSTYLINPVSSFTNGLLT